MPRTRPGRPGRRNGAPLGWRRDQPPALLKAHELWEGDSYADLAFGGRLGNRIRPWGDDLLGAPFTARVAERVTGTTPAPFTSRSSGRSAPPPRASTHAETTRPWRRGSARSTALPCRPFAVGRRSTPRPVPRESTTARHGVSGSQQPPYAHVRFSGAHPHAAGPCPRARAPHGRRAPGTFYLLTAKRIRACSSPCLIFPVTLITSSFHVSPNRTALATAQPLSWVSRLGHMSATCCELPPVAS